MWRYLLVLVFLLLYVEDSVRKLAVDNNPRLVLLKDVFVCVAYSLFFVNHALAGYNKRFTKTHVTICLYALVLSVLSLLNYYDSRTFFLGIRAYLWYLPLFFLGYEFFKTRESLIIFLIWVSRFSFVAGFFSIIQMMARNYGVSGILLSPFSTAHQIHSYDLGDIFYVTSFWGTDVHAEILFFFFISVNFFLAFYLKHPVYIVNLLLSIMGMATIGKRSAIVVMMLWLFFMLRQFFGRTRLRTVVGIILPFIGGAFIFLRTTKFEFYKEIPDALISERLPSIAAWFGDFSGTYIIGGKGFGILSQGTQYLGLGMSEYSAESSFIRIAYEMGVPGLICFASLLGYILLKAYTVSLKMKSAKNDFYVFPKAITLCFALLLVQSLWHQAIMSTDKFLILFWFFMGVIFGLMPITSSSRKTAPFETEKNMGDTSV